MKINRIGRLVMVAAIVATSLIAWSTTASAAQPTCQDFQVPVTVVGQNLEVHGQLCQPDGGSRTVMALVPGATYNSGYWNFPYEPDTYNFRLAMNRAGYATFTLDRLGTGASSKPLSTTVTATSQGNAIHQVIQWLRSRFAKVVIGGHSLGSLITIWEAATYQDVDAVLITGITHHANVVNDAALLADMHPAPLDPQFAGQGLDDGYVTTEPGTRGQQFYDPGVSDPNVVATDEATKDVFSATEFPDGSLASLLPLTTSINAPTLVVEGTEDKFMCGPPLYADCSSAAALQAEEAPDFSPAAHLRTYVLPDTGHDINLVPNTAAYQQAVVEWENAVVGS